MRAALVEADILAVEAVGTSAAQVDVLLAAASMRVRRIRAVALRRGMAGRLWRRRIRPQLREPLLVRG